MNSKATIKVGLGACLALLVAAGAAQAGKRVPGKVIRCGADADLVIKNRVIKTSATGVLTTGNCDLRLVNVKIVAGKYGAKISGNGDIHLEGCHVEGKKGALLITGNGDVHAKGSTFIGRVKVTGNGDLHKKGGNTFKKKK